MVEIRQARFVDIPEMLRLANEARLVSRFSELCDIDIEAFKAVALEVIGQQADKPGCGVVYVADNGDGLEGMIVGMVRRLYECLTIYVASDLIWYTDDRADTSTALRLARHFHEWASQVDGSIIIRHGITDSIIKPERVAKAFEGMGFRQSGVFYDKEIIR